MLDWLADTVYGEPNDLVVRAIDDAHRPQAGEFVKERKEFGKNSTVYHTNYCQPETATQLGTWFELPMPQRQ
jgi:hypothetical protein